MFGYINITNKLYTYIKKISGSQPLFLFNSDNNHVEVFPNSSFKFLVPAGLFSSYRVMLRDELKYPIANNPMTNEKDLSLPNLYPLQQLVVDKVVAAMKRKEEEHRPKYITLHLKCGFGKTVTACYLMAKERKRTVICVPNKMLIPQWKTAVELTKANYMISVHGVSKLLLEKSTPDVLIVVSRHFANEEFCNLVYSNYDVVIVDESHTYNLMNNSAMTRYLAFYPPPICYFLTATPRQSNRIYCNDIINVEKESSLNKTIKIIDCYFKPFSNEKIRNLSTKLNSTYNKYHVFTEKILTEDVHRNKLIIKTLVEEYTSRKINRIMIITKLRAHMLMFYNELVKKFRNDVVLGDAQNRKTPEIVNGLRSKDRFIFISTLYYAGTGLDLPSLDSLFVGVAVMNNMHMEQLLGRVCRETTLTDRTVYVFPTTSIREIKSVVDNYVQRLISLALDLGFVQLNTDKPCKEETALKLAFS
ncbi:DNA helicase transcript release factor [Pteropox virus]|uniref:DNA helicase transcript release factor n=1 Tax=Pteropox virus TaxID=1873698 RepID=A0A1B1MRI8_9POXV|nr:DNA helicase transcript release factor [Pteropox virus]ANS71197.1 DNA helicase transcript release factor [Pteropox virus]